MQYALLIYQDAPKIVEGLSPSELEAVGKEYGELSTTPGLTQTLPLGRPADATTVQVQDGKTVTSDGTVGGPGAIVSSFYLYESDDKAAAIDLASRIPAARLGGVIEVRPVEIYW
jgi:hypothetical protein